jgi:hypothetical protein
MTAQRFPGLTKYVGGNQADINNGSLSACALVGDGAVGVTAYIAGQAGASIGWRLLFNSGVPFFYVYGDTPQTKSASGGAIDGIGWNFICGTVSVANGLRLYRNGTVGSSTATYPTGNTAAPAASLDIGSNVATYSNSVAAVVVWRGVELTAAQVAAMSKKIIGISNTRGEAYAAATFTNTVGAGGQCCWIDGALSCFSDDTPMLGCQIPPGFTGAGLGGSGYFAHPSISNSLLQSDNLTATWGDVGTPVRAAYSTSTPYRDGRAISTFTDNDAGAVEGVSQSIDVTALATAATIQIQAIAKSPDATKLDLQVDESGVCAGSTVNFTACTINASTWTTCTWTWTLADGNCTTGAIKLTVGDWATVADVGTVYVGGMMAAKSIGYPVPIVIPTTTAAASGGGDWLRYSIGQPIVSATGTWVGNNTLKYTWTPFMADLAGPARSIMLRTDDGGIDTNRILVAWQSTEQFIFTVLLDSVMFSGAGQTLTPGTPESWIVRFNFDADKYTTTRNGSVLASSTSAWASPTGTNVLRVQASYDGASNPTGGALIKNVTISK